MKKPILKNHFVIGCVQTIGELWGILHREKSIYVRSWGRLHPCKFFLNNDLTFTIKRLEEMILNAEFLKVKARTSVTCREWLSYSIRQISIVGSYSADQLAHKLMKVRYEISGQQK